MFKVFLYYWRLLSNFEIIPNINIILYSLCGDKFVSAFSLNL